MPSRTRKKSASTAARIEIPQNITAQLGPFEVAIEYITPQIGEGYLANQVKNRNPTKKRVEIYAAEYIRDNWKLSGEFLIFDTQGRLINGGTRLTALIRSGVPFAPFLVIRGVHPDAVKVIDSGQPRSLAQALTMDGRDVSAFKAAILKGMFSTVGNFDPRIIPRQQIIEAFDLFEDSVNFAAVKHGKRAINLTHVRAVVARAHCCQDSAGVDLERLERFLYILDTGYVDEKTDNVVITLRYACQESSRQYASRHLLYLKTISALKAFLNYENPKKLVAASEQPWVIPAIDH